MKIHVVKSGDTFSGMERIYGVESNKIAEDNGIELNQNLLLGQAIGIFDDTIDKHNKKDVLISGYAFPNITEEALKESLNFLSRLCMFSYHAGDDGNLRPMLRFNAENIIAESSLCKSMVVANIGKDGFYCADLAQDILNNSDAVDNLINNIIHTLRTNFYLIVNIDFEYIYPNDKHQFSSFVQKLSEAVHHHGYSISCTLPPKMSSADGGARYGGYDYEFIGKTVDNVYLKGYGWQNMFMPQGPISPINNVEKALDYALSYIPNYKLFLGMQNYAFDWHLHFSIFASGRRLNNSDALSIAQFYNAEIKYDEAAQSPYFTYVNGFGIDNILWFEDVRSIKAKFDLLIKRDIAGISLWTVINPDKIFGVLANYMFNVL